MCTHSGRLVERGGDDGEIVKKIMVVKTRLRIVFAVKDVSLTMILFIDVKKRQERRYNHYLIPVRINIFCFNVSRQENGVFVEKCI